MRGYTRVLAVLGGVLSRQDNLILVVHSRTIVVLRASRSQRISYNYCSVLLSMVLSMICLDVKRSRSPSPCVKLAANNGCGYVHLQLGYDSATSIRK